MIRPRNVFIPSNGSIITKLSLSSTPHSTTRNLLRKNPPSTTMVRQISCPKPLIAIIVILVVSGAKNSATRIKALIKNRKDSKAPKAQRKKATLQDLHANAFSVDPFPTALMSEKKKATR
mmetsp:Transcript_8161/g.14801  ORF Transcript_8161/g.14801 Transcript_8161/m.14801 type:complete len:120 (-) Transcript_8161:805-1164(-)